MAKIEEKKPIIDEISEKIKDAQSVVLVDARGLTVVEDTQLRKQLREAGIQYKVYKNTYMKKAFDGTDFAQLEDDATAPARILYKFAEKAKNLEVKAGVVEGKAYDAKGLEPISKIPSREELLSKLLGSLQAPITNFARDIKQVAEKKAEGGEAAPAEAPAEAEAPAAE